MHGWLSTNKEGCAVRTRLIASTEADIECPDICPALIRSMVRTAESLKRTAYHESGHALVAFHTAGAHPIHKATIVPRGHALGMVSQVELMSTSDIKSLLFGNMPPSDMGHCTLYDEQVHSRTAYLCSWKDTYIARCLCWTDT
jgi:hypothetical protein